MNSFFIDTGSINLIALILLLGIVVIVLIFNSYAYLSSKDKILGWYNVYLLSSLLFAAWNFYKLISNSTTGVLYTVNSADQLIIAITGLAYLYFFGNVFAIDLAKKIFRLCWQVAIYTMYLQIALLTGAIFSGNINYFNPAVWSVIAIVITITSLVILLYSFFVKQKSLFQKIIMTGSVLFYVLALFGNLQEYYSRTGLPSGVNIIFIALIAEHIFFAVASANRVKNIFIEAAKLKISNYKHQLETEQVIGFFSSTIHQHNNTDEILWDVTKNCISKLGFEDCVIYLTDDVKKELIQKAAWGPKSTDDNKITNPITIPFGKGIVGAVALNNKAEIINDTSIDRRYIIDDANRLSEICVPINSGDKVLGVIDSENHQKNFYTGKHLLVLTAVASLLGNRLVKIRAEKFAKEKEIEVLTLRASNFQYQLEVEKIVSFFATAISAHHSADEMLWEISKNLIGQLGFEDCMIYLWNNDKTLLVQKAGYGLKGDMKVEVNRNEYNVPKGKGIVGAAAASGESILVNDTSKDERYFSADAKTMFSELCVPIVQQGETIGVINTEHSTRNFFTQRHLQILTTIASLCANKIDKMNAEQQIRKNEMEVLKLNKELAESQLTALRAQMNPHFIFNALNSIQRFTLKNDIDNANLYLSKFSMLLRKVLHSSQQNVITLEEEIEQLNLYLNIEKLRMGDEFFYSITADEEIEKDAIKIPGMLIQPFIENALKHGLALKEGSKNLDIKFSIPDNHLLQIAINDNGIGRTKAGEVKQQQQKLLPYESRGMALVQERLSLLWHTKSDNNGICILDKKDINGNPSGTSIIISLPLET